MVPTAWTEKDLDQMRSLGIDPAEVDRQIELFKDPPPFIQLVRPAVLGDGIVRLNETEIPDLHKKYEAAKKAGRFLKFVPASGAATRMFQTLFKFLGGPDVSKDLLKEKAKNGDADALQLLNFMERLPRVAFYSELEAVMADKGLDLKEALSRGDYGLVLRYLLTSDGLDYAQRPKGLIHFHDYGAEVRTSFEEQLIEGEQSATAIHFTVSMEHLDSFKVHHTGLRGRRRNDLVVDFSVQNPASQTIAVDESNRPFRDKEGRLVFRPAGHGSLIENLDRLKADLVFIKNIDNVSVGPGLTTSIHWKKILGGYLVQLQEKVFASLKALDAGSVDEAALLEMARFCREELRIDLGKGYAQLGAGDKMKALRKALDRPIRVCGVVKNTGEPGGGPFWVRGPQGKESLQIVESAQINMKDPGQKEAFDQATHFNPVDLVCGVKSWQGKPFSLKDYVDPSAIFISQKSVEGHQIKALELPGLWNGAMADWITVFVEVPIETFNPVKTVFDLLKPAHQAGSAEWG